MEVASIKTLFVIGVLTSRMIVPGMPQMPAGMGLRDMAAPTKAMTMELTSDKKVNASSKAQCAVPEGLKVGPKVDLAINLPVKAEGSTGTSGGEEVSSKPERFVMKTYWDCSETVVKGQPRVLDTDQMMKGLPKDMPKGMNMGKGGFSAMAAIPAPAASYGNGSQAYWPNHTDNKKIVKESSSPGLYELTTNYCGGTSIKIGPEQEFLGAFEVTSPGKNIDLSKTIKVEWKPIANARAYALSAFAGTKGEIVIWTSSSNPDVNVDWESRAFTNAEIKSYIDKGILLPASKTVCYIPAGIFKGMSAPMISLIAIGVDKTQIKDGIQTSVIVRSNATVMAGQGFGGPMMDESAMIEDEPADDSSDQDTASADSDEEEAPSPAQKPKSPAQKAKDALGKLGGIFK